MKSIIAIICLVLPSLLLAIKHRIEYGRFIQLSFSRAAILAMLVAYIFYVAIDEVNYIETVDGNQALSGYAKRFFILFILPGISISIIFFPKIAAEYTAFYSPLAKTALLDYFSLIGWALLFLSLVSSLAWLL